MGEKSKKINNGNNETQDINYDQLLQAAGDFGKYQLVLFFCTCPFYFFGVYSYFSQLFMTEVAPQHWCWIPELENLTITQRRNLAIPPDEMSPFGYSRCLAYDANWTEVLAFGRTSDQTWKTMPCENGWEFNKTEFAYPTISSEMGWVCEKNSYQATAQSLFFVGSIVGGFLVGWVADHYGRLPAAIFSNIIGAVAGTASAFTHNFLPFIVCRFFMGMSYDNCMIMVYLIVLEYSSPKYRTLMTNMTVAVFYTLAAVTLPWIALACGHWKTVALVTSLPMALSILAPLIMPESPRWMLSKGRIDDAIKQLLKIAKVNNKEIPRNMIQKFKENSLKNKEEHRNILDLMKRSLLRRIFICSCIQYMCCMIVFDALIRTIGQLKFDFFISFSVISFTEFPSIVIVSLALDFVGRKFISIVGMIISAIFSLMIPFVGIGLPSVICAVVARFAVNIAAQTALQWLAEMMPTPVRGSGTSIIHICGYIATVISPFVAYLETYMESLPMLVTGCIGLSAAIVCFFLPETARKDLPQTFENAEELVARQSWLEIPFLRKKSLK